VKNKYVIVRTYSAGVHCGTLVSQNGKEVLLKNARRIWKWTGAFTLSEVSQKGISGGCVSCTVPTIALTEAIEIIPCSADGKKSLLNIAEYRR
jgi:hypothetical protein